MSRRPRRSEQESRRLVMEAAVAHVSRHGLRAALDLPMEEVIAAADVPRAAAYRLWPARARFTEDVLEHLAQGRRVPTLSAADVDAVVAQVRADCGEDATPRQVVGELMARAVDLEHTRLAASQEWRGFLAFDAVVAAIPEAPTRERLLAGAARAEEEGIEQLVELYTAVAQALGMRERSQGSLRDAARAARVLARGLQTDAVRSGSVEQGRRVLAAASAAIIREALAGGEGRVQAGWDREVREAIRASSA